MMAARQRFKEAWRLACDAAEEWEKIEAHGAPVKDAYTNVAEAIPKFPTATDEQKIMLVKPIPDAIRWLHGDSYAGEPNRQHSARGLWKDWWEWWTSSRSRCESAYEHRLEVARAATAELRKAERVAARRAETARLRRARPDTTTAPDNE